MMKTIRSIPVLALALVAAACSSEADGAAAGPGGARNRPNSVTLAVSDLGVVQERPISAGWAITGNLEPLERVEVRARIEGDIDGVYVREGQKVQEGQLLARFRAVNETSDARSAEADVVSAKTDLETAKWNLDQTRDLFKEGAVPERDVKTAEQAEAAAAARLAAAQARLRSTATTLTDTRVLAPLSGTIETRTVAPGEHVNRTAPLFTLVRTDVLELAATVPGRAADEVTTGQSVRFLAGGRRYEGRVARVSPTITPGSRSVTLYAQVPNPNGFLKGGTFATGEVVIRTVENALVVPLTSVRQSPDEKPFIWKIQDGKLTRAAVTVGITDETEGVAQVVSGLEAGDRIVVGNVGTVGEGMEANVIGQKDSAEAGGEAKPAGGAQTGNGR
jgi:RND family efflux transporter MFP subunit